MKLEPDTYKLREYDTLEIPDVELTWRDERVLRRVLAGREDGKQLDVRQLPGRVEVKSSYWVGVARFEQFEVHVQPKLVGSEHVLIDMIDFATDAYGLRRFDALRTYEAVEDASLVELFALMLADSCERLVRQGLLADYVEREDLLPAVRGRILVDQQVMKRFGVVDRVHCRYDERVQNIAENQLLLLGLERAYRLVRRTFLKSRLRRLIRSFQEVCDITGFDVDAARRLQYHRLNEHYRNAHGLSWIIIDAAGLDSFFESGTAHGFSFFINMNTLFERFVEQLTRYMFPSDDYVVRTQVSDGSIIRHTASGGTYRAIRPDVLLERRANGRTLPIDAKYKLYDQKKIATADAYQLFFYANAYNLKDSPSALLLFPTTDGHRVDQLTVHDAAGRKMGDLVAAGVDVGRALAMVAENGPLQELRHAFSAADACAVPDSGRAESRPVPAQPNGLDELLALCLPEEERVVRECFRRHLRRPIVGFELKSGFAIIAEFSVAWPSVKVGVPLRHGAADIAAELGWTISTYDEVLQLIEARGLPQ